MSEEYVVSEYYEEITRRFEFKCPHCNYNQIRDENNDIEIDIDYCAFECLNCESICKIEVM